MNARATSDTSNVPHIAQSFLNACAPGDEMSVKKEDVQDMWHGEEIIEKLLQNGQAETIAGGYKVFAHILEQ